MPFYIHKDKLFFLSWHPIEQNVSPSYHFFLMVTTSYHSKVTPIIGALHAQ